MGVVESLRKVIPWEEFDYQALLAALNNYAHPRDKISDLIAKNVIIRVKKGLYIFGDSYRLKPYSREILANLIYGPSYVSLEYALSHHGLIPERVETITSITTRRSRDFDTPFGTFSYRMLKGPRYAVGAILETAGKTSFLVASPEKALADKVWTDKRFSGLRLSDYDAYLSDDLRIDREALSRFDYSRLQVIATAYDSAKINNLVRYLKRLEETPHA